LISLLSANYFSSQYPEFTFYLLPARIWELLAGGTLAKFEFDHGRTQNGWHAKIAPALGLLLIGSAVILFNNETPHPSFVTTLPVVGTMLIIWYAQKDEYITRMLSTKAIVFVGLVSYGFYLWHVPLFAFGKLKEGDTTQLDRLEWIILSFAISVVSYYLIENPARKTIRHRKLVLSSLAICALALSASGAFMYFTNGAEFRLAEANRYINYNYWSDENSEQFSTYEGCWLSSSHIDDKNDPYSRCKSSEPKEREHSILVLGDSYAASLIPGLITAFGRDNIVQRVVNGCVPINYIHEESDFCWTAYQGVFSDLEAIDPDIILIGGNYLHNSTLRSAVKVINSYLKEHKHKVMFVGPLPHWGGGLPKRLTGLFQLGIPLDGEVNITPKSMTFKLDSYAEQLAAENNFSYLSPLRAMCDMESHKCLAKQKGDGNQMTSWDWAHLTVSGSHFLINAVSKDIRNQLNQ
jgi:hypothetical protein